MARAMGAVGRPTGPGMVGTIIFLILCLALIIAYIPLFMAFDQASNARNDLVELVHENLDRPLTGIGVPLTKQPPAEISPGRQGTALAARA